jgi:hypothetical protein
MKSNSGSNLVVAVRNGTANGTPSIPLTVTTAWQKFTLPVWNNASGTAPTFELLTWDTDASTSLTVDVLVSLPQILIV